MLNEIQKKGVSIAPNVVKHFTDQEDTTAEQECMVVESILDFVIAAIETAISFGMEQGGAAKGKGGMGSWVTLVIEGIIFIAEGAADWEKMAKEDIERAHVSSDNRLITDQTYSSGLCKRLGAGVVNENFERTGEMQEWVQKLTGDARQTYADLFDIVRKGIPRNDSVENGHPRTSVIAALLNPTSIVDSSKSLEREIVEFKS